MSALVSQVSRGAGFGALIGGSIECLTQFESKGLWLAVCTVAGAAFSLIAALFSPGAAAGAFLGPVLHYFVNFNIKSNLHPVAFLGAIILGGTLGHLVGPILSNAIIVL